MNQKNKKPPKFLYRFFSNKCEKYTEHIFKCNELYFRNPSKFNDPFDCKALLTLKRDCDQEEYVKFVRNNAIDSIGRNLDNEEKQLYKESAIKVFKNSDRNQLSRNINNTIKECLYKSINEFRILCLSRNYNDILMWSHYAEGHRGFVLQFDTKALLENFKQPPQEVVYPPNKSFPSIKDFNEKNCVHMFLITKSSQWEYEEEWRILMHIEYKDNPEEKGKGYKFKNGLITGIILGCEMKDPKKEKISEWIREYQPQVKIYDAIKDENFYNIRTNPEINEYKYLPSQIS